jgi:CubicO group peptidase (beta-lactamase class C family)
MTCPAGNGVLRPGEDEASFHTHERMKITRITALITFLLIALFFKAQHGVALPGHGQADSLIKAFMLRWKINGGSVAIAKDGKLIYSKGFGYADNGRSQPASPYHLFRVASLSKPVTSIAIMKLVEEGRLSLTDTVFGHGKILDQPYYLDVISDARIYNITVQQLLEHTAGWETAVPYKNNSHCDPVFFPLQVTQEEEAVNPVPDSTLVRFSLRNGVHHEPGKVFAYSNIGYLVLGKIIEKLSSGSYEAFVSHAVLQPAGVADMHAGKNLLCDKLEREAEYDARYRVSSCYGNGTEVPAQYGGFNLEAMNAHGGWVATSEALVKLILAVDGFDSRPDILSPRSIQTMSSAGIVNKGYAKGWAVNAHGNWWHTGSLDGTAALMCRSADGYVFSFLFNSRSDNSEVFWTEFDALPWRFIRSLNVPEDINLFQPAVNVSGLTVLPDGSGGVQVTWREGAGTARMVVLCEGDKLDKFPDAAKQYMSGTPLGKNGKVIYNGTGNGCRLEKIDPSKTYYITAFEYYKNANTAGKEIYVYGNRVTTVFAPALVNAERVE